MPKTLGRQLSKEVEFSITLRQLFASCLRIGVAHCLHLPCKPLLACPPVQPRARRAAGSLRVGFRQPQLPAGAGPAAKSRAPLAASPAGSASPTLAHRSLDQLGVRLADSHVLVVVDDQGRKLWAKAQSGPLHIRRRNPF
jgi:hypothetical protein